MLVDFLHDTKTISYQGCMTQIFFPFLGLSSSLPVLAYDTTTWPSPAPPYVTIMNTQMCVGLEVAAWVGALSTQAVQLALMLPLPFCGPNILNSFYCDIPQVLRLCLHRYLPPGVPYDLQQWDAGHLMVLAPS